MPEERVAYLIQLARDNQFTDVPLSLSFARHATRALNSTLNSVALTSPTFSATQLLLKEVATIVSTGQETLKGAINSNVKQVQGVADVELILSDISILLNSGELEAARKATIRAFDVWSIMVGESEQADQDQAKEHLQLILDFASAFANWLHITSLLLRELTTLALDDRGRRVGIHLLWLEEHVSTTFAAGNSGGGGGGAHDDSNDSMLQNIDHNMLLSLSNYEVLLLRGLDSGVTKKEEVRRVRSMKNKGGVQSGKRKQKDQQWDSYVTEMFRGKHAHTKTKVTSNNEESHPPLHPVVKGSARHSCRKLLCNAQRREQTRDSLHLHQSCEKRRPFSHDQCEFDVLDASNLHQKLPLLHTLMDDYVRRGKPVLLRNATSSMGMKSLQFKELSTRFGQSRVMSTRSSDVNVRQSDVYDHPMTIATVSTVDEFVMNMKSDASFDECNPSYVFATLEENILDEMFPPLDEDLPAAGELSEEPSLGTDHEIFGAWTSFFRSTQRFSMTNDDWSTAALFYVGGEMSGTYFHSHTNALNILMSGSKKWFLTPKRYYYGPTHVSSIVNWYTTHRPLLPFAPLECVQREGDVLFVPEDWNHAVMNLENVIGVAVEMGKDE